jgi:hypothetical protein
MEFLRILSEYGVVGLVSLFIVSVFLKVLMKDYKWRLSAFVDSIATPDETNQKDAELRYHPFFTSAHYKIVAEIPTLDLCPSKPVKQQMFRDLIIIYVKNMINTCSDIIENDMSDWSGSKWANETCKDVNKMVTSFQNMAIDAGIPREALLKFLKWHYPTLEMLYEYIGIFGNSKLYADNVIRTNTFLLTMNLLMVTTLGDAERSLREINGEIGGKLYKGNVIEH